MHDGRRRTALSSVHPSHSQASRRAHGELSTSPLPASSQALSSDKAEKPQAKVVHELMRLVALPPLAMSFVPLEPPYAAFPPPYSPMSMSMCIPMHPHAPPHPLHPCTPLTLT